MADASLLEQAEFLRELGLTYAKIGKMLGRSNVTIHRWLNPEWHREKKRRQRAANPETYRERKRRQRATEGCKASRRKYREKNREQIAEKRKQYNEANRDTLLAKQRERWASHPELNRERRRQYEATETGRANKRKRQRRYMKKRLATDPAFRERMRVCARNAAAKRRSKQRANNHEETPCE